MAPAPKHDRHDHPEVRNALGDLGGLLDDLAPADAAPAVARPAAAVPRPAAAMPVPPPARPARTPRAAAPPAPTTRAPSVLPPEFDRSPAEAGRATATATTPAPAPLAAPAATPAPRRAPLDDPLAPVFAELASLRLEVERMKAAAVEDAPGQGLEGWRFAILLCLGLVLLAAVVVQIVKA